jgi:hypothetical protein
MKQSSLPYSQESVTGPSPAPVHTHALLATDFIKYVLYSQHFIHPLHGVMGLNIFTFKLFKYRSSNKLGERLFKWIFVELRYTYFPLVSSHW